MDYRANLEVVNEVAIDVECISQLEDSTLALVGGGVGETVVG